MLVTRLEDPRRLGDWRYSAEPKLDGQRAQLHVRDYRTVRAFSRPGLRSPAWLKLKPKLTLEVVVTGGSADRVRWGNWGEAVMLAFRYTHPRTDADVEIRQAVRVPRDLPFDVQIGARHELVCWGVMPSGMLPHPVSTRR